MNRHVATVIVAPMTTKGHVYPTRVPCRFQKKNGLIMLDQLRTVDKARLVKKLGPLAGAARQTTLTVLEETFAP